MRRWIGPTALVVAGLILHAHFTDWSTQCEPPALLFLWERGPTSPLSPSLAPCPAGYYFGLMPAAGIRTEMAWWLGLVLPLALWAVALLWAVRSRRA
jgi:hypothetical protein